MTAASNTPAPGTPAPSGPPPGPTGPTPTGPDPQRYADVFDLALTLGPATAIDLARPHKPSPPSKPPRKPINTKPIRGVETPACSFPAEAAVVFVGGKAGGPVEPDSEGGRAGALPRSGAATRCEGCPGTCRSRLDCIGRPVRIDAFILPPVSSVPRFGDGPVRPGQPGPPTSPQPGPVPQPPPPLGVGPLYDALPGSPR